MTDWRTLCEELVEALEIQLDELRFDNRLCKRARAALAQPEPEVVAADTGAILALAAIIREVDGNHSLGAAALAEAILGHPGSRWGRPAPAAEGEPPVDLIIAAYRSGVEDAKIMAESERQSAPAAEVEVAELAGGAGR